MASVALVAAAPGTAALGFEWVEYGGAEAYAGTAVEGRASVRTTCAETAAEIALGDAPEPRVFASVQGVAGAEAMVEPVPESACPGGLGHQEYLARWSLPVSRQEPSTPWEEPLSYELYASHSRCYDTKSCYASAVGPGFRILPYADFTFDDVALAFPHDDIHYGTHAFEVPIHFRGWSNDDMVVDVYSVAAADPEPVDAADAALPCVARDRARTLMWHTTYLFAPEPVQPVQTSGVVEYSVSLGSRPPCVDMVQRFLLQADVYSTSVPCRPDEPPRPCFAQTHYVRMNVTYQGAPPQPVEETRLWVPGLGNAAVVAVLAAWAWRRRCNR